jgi:hypothetical protein
LKNRKIIGENMGFMKMMTDRFDKWTELTTSGKEVINQKIKDKIRDKAYKNAIERCKQSNVNPDDLSSDEMGVIVNEEDKKIRDTIKDMSFKTVIGFLGLEAILD